MSSGRALGCHDAGHASDPKDVPLLTELARTASNASRDIRMVPVAVAVRLVSGFALTSTIRADPSAATCDSPRLSSFPVIATLPPAAEAARW
jgi:hypothetical protein